MYPQSRQGKVYFVPALATTLSSVQHAMRLRCSGGESDPCSCLIARASPLLLLLLLRRCRLATEHRANGENGMFNLQAHSVHSAGPRLNSRHSSQAIVGRASPAAVTAADGANSGRRRRRRRPERTDRRGAARMPAPPPPPRWNAADDTVWLGAAPGESERAAPPPPSTQSAGERPGETGECCVLFILGRCVVVLEIISRAGTSISYLEVVCFEAPVM